MNSAFWQEALSVPAAFWMHFARRRAVSAIGRAIGADSWREAIQNYSRQEHAFRRWPSAHRFCCWLDDHRQRLENVDGTRAHTRQFRAINRTAYSRGLCSQIVGTCHVRDWCYEPLPSEAWQPGGAHVTV